MAAPDFVIQPGNMLIQKLRCILELQRALLLHFKTTSARFIKAEQSDSTVFSFFQG